MKNKANDASSHFMIDGKKLIFIDIHGSVKDGPMYTLESNCTDRPTDGKTIF